MNDLISRQSAIDILNKCYAEIELDYDRPRNCYEEMFYTRLKTAFVSAQPEPCIPLSDGEYGEIMYRLNEKLKKDQE